MMRASSSVGSTRTPRLPVDAVARGASDRALVLGPRNDVSEVRLTPAHECTPWREMLSPSHQNLRDRVETVRRHRDRAETATRSVAEPIRRSRRSRQSPPVPVDRWSRRSRLTARGRARSLPAVGTATPARTRPSSIRRVGAQVVGQPVGRQRSQAGHAQWLGRRTLDAPACSIPLDCLRRLHPHPVRRRLHGPWSERALQMAARHYGGPGVQPLGHAHLPLGRPGIGQPLQVASPRPPASPRLRKRPRRRAGGAPPCGVSEMTPA